MFGGHLESQRLPWAWAVHQLTEARHYWIGTTRPDGRPHSRPVWGVWLDNRLYFSTGSLAAGNLASSPEITVHVESSQGEAVIIEGVAEQARNSAVLRQVLAVYNKKYLWDMDPDHPDGPLYAVKPRVVFGWVSDPSGLDHGAAFHGTATRWLFA
jgi:Pyridoxamine 5'-phosphate oxidase